MFPLLNKNEDVVDMREKTERQLEGSRLDRATRRERNCGEWDQREGTERARDKMSGFYRKKLGKGN